MLGKTDRKPEPMPEVEGPKPPSWYPSDAWVAEEEGFFFVPEDMRAEYASVPLHDADLKRWLEPTKAMFAGPVRDGLPEGLRFTDVAKSIDMTGRPALMGYLVSDGGMAAVRAFQHEHALREVRQHRAAMERSKVMEAQITRLCSVCGERVPLPDVHHVGGVPVCSRHVAVLLAAVTRLAETEVLPDGRTALDAALTMAGTLGPAPRHQPPAGDLPLPPTPPDRSVPEFAPVPAVGGVR